MKSVFASLAFAVATFTAQAAIVQFVPSSMTVLLGDEFTVSIVGTGFPSAVDGGGFDITIVDPAVIQFKAVGALADVTFAPGWNFLNDRGTLDLSAGTVTDLFFNGFPAVAGPDFTIADLRFKATALGTTDLFLNANIFAFGSGGDAIATEFAKGKIQVVPEPATWELLAGGLLLAGWLGARRRHSTWG